MDNKDIIVLEVDINKVDLAIKDLLNGFEKINLLTKEISTSITKAFAPIHSSLVSVQECLSTMSVNVSSLTANMQVLSKSLMPSGEETGGALDGISTGTRGRFSCPFFLLQKGR